LYELFLITTEISRGLTGGNLKHIKQALKGFFGIQAYVIWTKGEGNWKILLKDGTVRPYISDDSEKTKVFEELSKNLVFNDWKIGTAP
ncbi:sensor histidine kinase, partial [Bacillus thuringiensis]|nr:sensor histidine kinase [Bacillus thuringiensis]